MEFSAAAWQAKEIMRGQVTHVQSLSSANSREVKWYFRIGGKPCTFARRSSVVSLSDGDLVTLVGFTDKEGGFFCHVLRNDSTGITYSPTVGMGRFLGVLCLIL